MLLYKVFFFSFYFLLYKLNFFVGKSADNNESFKNKMSDNDKNNEKTSKMNKRIKTL